MRLGLIARADSRGLGVQTKAVFDNLHPAKTMVVDCPSAKPLPLRRDWYPGATWIHGLPTAGDFRTWLDGLTHVYTAETSYNRAFWDEADRAGVKTMLAANYEFLDRRDRPTLWAMPSMWHYDDVPFSNKTFLPVPVEVDRFTPNTAREATRFLHIVGRPAIHDRNGTEDLIAALRHITSQVTVTFRCQEPGYVESRLATATVPANVKVVVESGDVADNADMYRDQDVLVLPRRFGGLCLPVNEALAAGMPVIMPCIEPNMSWLPYLWLVDDADIKTSFMAKTKVDVYATNPRSMARTVDYFAQYQEFFTDAQDHAREMSAALSWDSLKPLYEKTFEEL